MEVKEANVENKMRQEDEFAFSCAELDQKQAKKLNESLRKQALILEQLKREVTLIEEIGTIEKTKASAYSDEKATKSLAFAYKALDLGDDR